MTSALPLPTVELSAQTWRLMLVTDTSSESISVSLPIPVRARASAHQEPTPPRPNTATWLRFSRSMASGRPAASGNAWFSRPYPFLSKKPPVRAAFYQVYLSADALKADGELGGGGVALEKVGLPG
jgi:hypothetical protein